MASDTPLRYATPERLHTETYAGTPRVLTHSSLTRPGARTPWSEDPDNPMSPAFVPLTERGERGKARFWARNARRRGRQIAGIFDEQRAP